MSGARPDSLRWRFEKAIRDDERLSASEKLVGFALKSRAQRTGDVWTGVEQLASETRLSVRAVQYALHGRGRRLGLIALGYATVRSPGGGRSKTTRYRLGVPENGGTGEAKRCTTDLETVHNRPGNGAPGAPEDELKQDELRQDDLNPAPRVPKSGHA